MQVEYSEIAKFSLKENIDFLKRVWTDREADILLNDISVVLENLKSGNFHQYQKEYKNIRSALIGKRHIRMFFREEKEKIKVLLFFDMRENPRKIPKLLKQ
ncbi:MAG: hypothetical protein QM564_12290 [Bergeyella sp.]